MGANKHSDQMRKMECHKGLKLNYTSFKDEVDIWLDKIDKAMISFDFLTIPYKITDYGPKHILLWNEIMLFFFRGLYTEPPFPWMLNIGDISNDPPAPK